MADTTSSNEIAQFAMVYPYPKVPHDKERYRQDRETARGQSNKRTGSLLRDRVPTLKRLNCGACFGADLDMIAVQFVAKQCSLNPSLLCWE